MPPSWVCESSGMTWWRDRRRPANRGSAGRLRTNVCSFLKHINFQRRVRLIAQRQHLLIFGIIVPALGRGLVREPNYDANLELAGTVKTPQTGAPRDRLAAVLCDDGAGGLLILRQRFLAFGMWGALDQNNYAHKLLLEICTGLPKRQNSAENPSPGPT